MLRYERENIVELKFHLYSSLLQYNKHFIFSVSSSGLEQMRAVMKIPRKFLLYKVKLLLKESFDFSLLEGFLISFGNEAVGKQKRNSIKFNLKQFND